MHAPLARRVGFVEVLLRLAVLLVTWGPPKPVRETAGDQSRDGSQGSATAAQVEVVNTTQLGHPAAAPVIPKDMKIRRLDAPPPPKELVAPSEMPLTVPQEADPSLDKGIAVYGDGPGDVYGIEGGLAGGEAGGALGPIELPQGAEPPQPSKRNRRPTYPQVALTEQRTGLVILKVVINTDGMVENVQVVRGESHHEGSIAAVKKRYDLPVHGPRFSVVRCP